MSHQVCRSCRGTLDTVLHLGTIQLTGFLTPDESDRPAYPWLTRGAIIKRPPKNQPPNGLQSAEIFCPSRVIANGGKRLRCHEPPFP